MSACEQCDGYGWVQVQTSARLKLVYCDCPEGQRRLKHRKAVLRNLGEDPENGCFHSMWTVLSEIKSPR
jgi:hypothetical protein